MEITAFALVENQSLCFHSYGKLQAELAFFEGKEVQIEIRKKKSYRSGFQNRYYWGAVIPSIKYAMESKGFLIKNKETVHDLLKLKFLKGEILNIATGELIETIGSTTNLSKSDFSDYIEKIKAWAAQYLECVIPEANESLTIQ